MIAVGRHATAAGAGEVDAALASLNHRPGVWLGCDVELPGLYRRRARVALDPLVLLQLDGTELRLLALDDTGRALAARWAQGPSTTGWTATPDGLRADVAEPGRALALLRALLASFEVPPPELGLYGMLAFDYWRLQDPDGLPDDGRRRVVLMLPRRVLCIDGDSAQRVDFDFPGLSMAGAATPAASAMVPPARLERRDDDHPLGGHAAVVAQGVERMRRGELASLVLSQTFRRPAADADAAAAFARLRRDNPYPAMFFVHAGGGERVFGASPDIQVRADAEWVETAPVCGTFRRGSDPLDDYLQAKGLMNSAVDEASLAVCADSDRNDKAQVCVPGSVEQVSRRRLHFFSTIIHAIDHTRGRRRADVDALDIVLTHATPATVTGMPKTVARRVIEQLEPGWRGWYAGAAVRLGADGGCEALTMLRFARLVDGIAEVRTGGSLLADSDPVREEQETQLKAETLFRVLAGGSPRAPVAPAAPPSPCTLRFVDGGDPLAALMREALVQAGARFDDGAALRVLGDGPLEAWQARIAADDAALPTLALNHAGLALLMRDGARPEPLQPPQFARSLACRVEPGCALQGPDGQAWPDEIELGIYSALRLDADALPRAWQLLVRGADGRVVAAWHPASRSAVLLARPDSVLSLRHAAGSRLLAALLHMLDTSRPPHPAGDPSTNLQENHR